MTLRSISSLCLLATLCGICGTVAAQGGPPGGMPPPPVRVAEARMTALAPTIPIPGAVVSRDDTRMAAETAGRLVQLAEVGTLVAKGDVVARIDQSLVREQRKQFQAELARIEAQIGFLERDTRRLQQLATANNAAEREFDDSSSQLDVARRDLEAARSRLAQNQIELDRSELRAPFDGRVTQRFVNPQERVAIGALVARLVGVARIEVIAQATVEAVRYLYEGADVRISDSAGREGIGRVKTLVPFGDSTRHMYEMRIDVDADDWLVAQAVELSVPVAAPEQVLAIPRDALVLRRDDTYVMRLNGEDQAERVSVTTGLSDGALIAVDGDLQAGDRVVIRGAERLMPGQTVRVLAEPAGAVEAAAEVSATD